MQIHCAVQHESSFQLDKGFLRGCLFKFFFSNKLNVLGLEAIKLDVTVKYNSENACDITLAYCKVVIILVSAGAMAMKLHRSH